MSKIAENCDHNTNPGGRLSKQIYVPELSMPDPREAV
jgi:hypothetical protein